MGFSQFCPCFALMGGTGIVEFDSFNISIQRPKHGVGCIKPVLTSLVKHVIITPIICQIIHSFCGSSANFVTRKEHLFDQ